MLAEVAICAGRARAYGSQAGPVFDESNLVRIRRRALDEKDKFFHRVLLHSGIEAMMPSVSGTSVANARRRIRTDLQVLPEERIKCFEHSHSILVPVQKMCAVFEFQVLDIDARLFGAVIESTCLRDAYARILDAVYHE